MEGTRGSEKVRRVGRCGETWEMWGDMGRCGEMVGGGGRWWEMAHLQL